MMSKLIYSFKIYLSKPKHVLKLEGKNFDACEDEAWKIYQHYLNCSEHFLNLMQANMAIILLCNKCGYFQLTDVLLSGLKELYSL